MNSGFNQLPEWKEQVKLCCAVINAVVHEDENKPTFNNLVDGIYRNADKVGRYAGIFGMRLAAMCRQLINNGKPSVFSDCDFDDEFPDYSRMLDDKRNRRGIYAY